MKKSKLAIERDKFLNSDEGISLCIGTTSDQYLRNRIESAFLAGIKVGKCLQQAHAADADKDVKKHPKQHWSGYLPD